MRTYTCPIAKSCGGCEVRGNSPPLPSSLSASRRWSRGPIAARRNTARLRRFRCRMSQCSYRHKAAYAVCAGLRVCGVRWFIPPLARSHCARSSCPVGKPWCARRVQRRRARPSAAASPPTVRTAGWRCAMPWCAYAITQSACSQWLPPMAQGFRAEKFVNDIRRKTNRRLAHCPEHQRAPDQRDSRSVQAVYHAVRSSVMRARPAAGCSFEIGPTSFFTRQTLRRPRCCTGFTLPGRALCPDAVA